MSLSDSVRMALKKARKNQTDLIRIWGNSKSAMSNKFRLERLSGRAADPDRSAGDRRSRRGRNRTAGSLKLFRPLFVVLRCTYVVRIENL